MRNKLALKTILLFLAQCFWLLSIAGAALPEIRIPSQYGTVKEIFEAEPSGQAGTRPTIIHIQDAHCNYEAQKNMAKVLDYLAKEHNVLSNNISLHRGAQTGGYNLAHAISDGANGGIFNHSERRLRLETAMTAMVKSVRSMDRSAPDSGKKIGDIWKATLKTENLSDTEIENTLSWLQVFQSRRRDEKAIERLARRLTNYIINLQLKEVIAYSKSQPITQIVLCVGETRGQYEAKRTNEVLEEDLEEILDGISAEDAQKIGLRIAYEPRWAIRFYTQLPHTGWRCFSGV